MATITLSVSGSAVGTITRTVTLDQANSDAAFAYVLDVYAQDAQGNPLGPVQSVEAMLDGVIKGVLANIDRHKRDAAARAAAEAEPQIAATIS